MGPRALIGAITASPASIGPHQQATTIQIGTPCSGSGIHGAAGARRTFSTVVSSSGACRRPPAVDLHHLGTALEREEHRSREHRRSDRVRSEAERRDHAEVAAAAPESPEQVRVVVLARGGELPVGRDDVGPHEVVDVQAVLAGEPPDPAAEGETGDARVRHDPGRDREPERLREAIELAEGDAGLDLREAVPLVDPDTFQRGQVDDQAVVAERETTHAVPAAPHRHPQVALAREPHRAPDVRCVRAPRDEPWPPVDRAVPDRARLVVSLVAWSDQPAAEALAERLQRRRRHRAHGRVVGRHRSRWWAKGRSTSSAIRARAW